MTTHSTLNRHIVLGAQFVKAHFKTVGLFDFAESQATTIVATDDY